MCSWTISHVSWLKTADFSGTICVPIIRVRCDLNPSPNHFIIDHQSVGLSWCRGPFCSYDYILNLKSVCCSHSRLGASSLTRGRICQHVACDRSWAQANGILVGGIKSLLVLVLSPDWFVSVLLYHISHRVPGPTEIETPVPIGVSGSLLY
jgi:hypothetical protein